MFLIHICESDTGIMWAGSVASAKFLMEWAWGCRLNYFAILDDREAR